MYKDVLRAIENVGIYPVISLAIFFTFFVVLGIYWLRVDKKLIKQLEQLPLEDHDKDVTIDSVASR